MSHIDNQDRIPLLGKSRLRTFPRTRCTIFAMTAQVIICGLAWAFAVVLFVKKSKSIPLPDSAANWIYYNQSEKTIIATLTSTVLAIVTGTGQVLFGGMLNRRGSQLR